MPSYYQVLISAENHEQANAILDALLEKKLVLGGPILAGPAKFWWKGKVVSMEYCYILTYTLEHLKDRVIAAVDASSAEEVPMVSLIPMEGNGKLLQLIEETLQ